MKQERTTKQETILEVSMDSEEIEQIIIDEIKRRLIISPDAIQSGVDWELSPSEGVYAPMIRVYFKTEKTIIS